MASPYSFGVGVGKRGKMQATTSGSNTNSVVAVRVRIFVDFWNFTLSVRNEDSSFKINWQTLGQIIAAEAGKLVDASLPVKYEGMHVYGSYDPAKPNDAKLRNWFTNTLDKMAGVSVTLVERQRKRTGPTCPHCQTITTHCPSCGGDMRGTEEKGVDTRIVTDLISLAWINGFDVAVLVSSDRDFVPVAEFLQAKGIKVIHGAFPPVGSQLSQKCWGHLNLVSMMPTFKR